MTIIVENLSVALVSSDAPVVCNVSFEIAAGKVLGLVGESGSGKTTLALALLGYARKGTRIKEGGCVKIDGRNILELVGPERRDVRGRLVSYVPQDPTASLNPSMTVGDQMLEVLTSGVGRLQQGPALARIKEILIEVSLPSDKAFLESYPSQLSGGQQQRVGIAMAVAVRPRMIVLDEPTTGLDASTQKDVLSMISRLCADHDIAAVYVSHDLGVISHVADHVVVLYAGRVVEQRDSKTFFTAPAHPYSRALIEALPSLHEKRKLKAIPGQPPLVQDRGKTCTFIDRCQYADAPCEVEPALTSVDSGRSQLVRCYFPRINDPIAGSTIVEERSGLGHADTVLTIRKLQAAYGTKTILRDVDLHLRKGECLAILGESGSGKTTLSRCVVGLHYNWSGSIELSGQPLSKSSVQRERDQQRRIQFIFQNPFSSLNPRRTVGASIALAASHFDRTLSRQQIQEKVKAVLSRVNLRPSYRDRYPNELSGGEKQRVAIARALVSSPEIIICDEVTSALDVSVQAAIIELLRSLVADGLSLLFVTHNIAVVRSLADRVAILEHGLIVEHGPVREVIEAPRAAYTKSLIANTIEI